MALTVHTTPLARVLVCGMGLRTSVGLTVAANSAAIRGRLNAFKEYEWLPSPRDGHSMLVAALSTLLPDMPLLSRMAHLAECAAREALATIQGMESLRGQGLPLLISLPPERPGWTKAHNARLVSELIRALPVPIDGRTSRMLDTGHHGTLALLATAVEILQNGLAPACLLGGVECFIDSNALDWLDRQLRLKAADSPNGFVPGEGSGFVLLGSDTFVAELGLQPAAEVLRCSQSVDATPWYLGVPTLGNGLAAVFQELLPADGVKAEIIFGDLNGEPWRVDEWTVAYLRTGERHSEPLNLEHPADSWGDLGAASGGALLALSSFEFMRRQIDGPRTALLFTASDTGPFRSGCLIAKNTQMLDQPSEGENKWYQQ